MKKDVYYNPEHFGLQIVYERNFSRASYEFDIRVVWKDDQGFLYTARDAGCSCPSPFENYTSIHDLERVPLGMMDFRQLDEDEYR